MDMSTMMPACGAAARAEQRASLQVGCHGILVDPALADLLDEAGANAKALDPWQGANLREMRHQWIHAAAVDAKLVEALSKAVRLCETVWSKARTAAGFAMEGSDKRRVWKGCGSP